MTMTKKAKETARREWDTYLTETGYPNPSEWAEVTVREWAMDECYAAYEISGATEWSRITPTMMAWLGLSRIAMADVKRYDVLMGTTDSDMIVLGRSHMGTVLVADDDARCDIRTADDTMVIRMGTNRQFARRLREMGCGW